jgi:hypothetical protein
MDRSRQQGERPNRAGLPYYAPPQRLLSNRRSPTLCAVRSLPPARATRPRSPPEDLDHIELARRLKLCKRQRAGDPAEDACGKGGALGRCADVDPAAFRLSLRLICYLQPTRHLLSRCRVSVPLSAPLLPSWRGAFHCAVGDHFWREETHNPLLAEPSARRTRSSAIGAATRELAQVSHRYAPKLGVSQQRRPFLLPRSVSDVCGPAWQSGP